MPSEPVMAPKPAPEQAPPGTPSPGGPSEPAPSARVYVGNLPWAVGDDDLAETFTEVGTVVEAKVSPPLAGAWRLPPAPGEGEGVNSFRRIAHDQRPGARHRTPAVRPGRRQGTRGGLPGSNRPPRTSVERAEPRAPAGSPGRRFQSGQDGSRPGRVPWRARSGRPPGLFRCLCAVTDVAGVAAPRAHVPRRPVMLRWSFVAKLCLPAGARGPAHRAVPRLRLCDVFQRRGGHRGHQ